MPRIEITGAVPEDLDPFTSYQIYNNFDSAITAQLLAEMTPLLDNLTGKIYAHEMELQKLCLEMSSKGFPVDLIASSELIHRLNEREKRALHILNSCTQAIGFGDLNPNSPKQVQSFFYGHLNIPEIKVYDKQTRQQKVTTDIKALEKIRARYPVSIIFVNAILGAREASKMASVFRRGLEHDYRLRCNFNPAGTDTGRMSSQRNPFGRGTNAQNLTNEVRQVISDPNPDYYILNADLKTAESIAVGYISGDRAYIDACESGDLHTAVARMNWKDIPWTGELRLDRELAEAPFYRMFSFRDMAKRAGHLTNYHGAARTNAQALKLPIKTVEEFQERYFAAFPGIQRWHLRVIAEIQTTGIITTAFGRKRRFWGRSSDPATHRAAIAFDPQSLVADVENTALLAAQRWIISNGLDHTSPAAPLGLISLLAQVHDSGVFLVHKSFIHEAVENLRPLLKVPIDFPNIGTMIIPTDFTVGRRWYKSKSDPLAQRDYSPEMKF